MTSLRSVITSLILTSLISCCISTSEFINISRAIRQVVIPGQRSHFMTFNGSPMRGPATPSCNCLPVVACIAQGSEIPSACTMQNGGTGVCCHSINRARFRNNANVRLFTQPKPEVRMRSLTTKMLNTACEHGKKVFKATKRHDQELLRKRQVVEDNTPRMNHLKVFTTSQRTREMSERADEILESSRAMKVGFALTRSQGAHGLQNFDVQSTILGSNCPKARTCNPRSKYRTITGECNNLNHPLYGMTSTANQRIMPPKYDDGIWDPRARGVDGSILPNPRVVARSVLLDIDNPDPEFTISVMQWAQFIDHDLAHVPFYDLNGEGIECCPDDKIPSIPVHRYCNPIPIAHNDPFYGPREKYCMNFVRSRLGLDEDCKFGHAEQINQVTHWIDGSEIYGSDHEEERHLRLYRNGLMKTSRHNQLPYNLESPKCEALERGAHCYIAGDSRVNEQPGLTVIHIVWHREHNRVASELQRLNPWWNDEQVFQEARRIVVAEYQHITFNEWLPIIVGPRFMQSFDINPLQSGYSFDYNSNINPSMNSEFSTAAFRFGHSLVQGFMKMYSATGAVSTIRLRDHFNTPHLIQEQPEVVDMIIRSMSSQNIQRFDAFVTEDLSNHLFQTKKTGFGMDLMALNIHRGRDHAIATYNEVRQICGLKKARSFQDITDQIPPIMVKRLQKVYKHVDDIDFFVGGMAEKPVSSRGLLGWTFLCVVGDQFARLKKGDRFFYDVGGQPGSFTPSQLQEIRKASWSRILCDTGDQMHVMQPLAFKLKDDGINRPVSCQSPSIPRVNLQHWRGERPGV